MDKPKKKMSRQQRQQRRAEMAEVYKDGFEHGYSMGFDEAYRQMKLELNKRANFGR